MESCVAPIQVVACCVLRGKCCCSPGGAIFWPHGNGSSLGDKQHSWMLMGGGVFCRDS